VQMPGAEMNVSDLVRDVSCCGPHFDVTDGMTYIADKGTETWDQGWPICMRLGSLAVQKAKEAAGLRSYCRGSRRQLTVTVWNRRWSNPGQWGRGGIGPVSMAEHGRSCKEVRTSTV